MVSRIKRPPFTCKRQKAGTSNALSNALSKRTTFIAVSKKTNPSLGVQFSLHMQTSKRATSKCMSNALSKRTTSIAVAKGNHAVHTYNNVKRNSVAESHGEKCPKGSVDS